MEKHSPNKHTFRKTLSDINYDGEILQNFLQRHLQMQIVKCFILHIYQTGGNFEFLNKVSQINKKGKKHPFITD